MFHYQLKAHLTQLAEALPHQAKRTQDKSDADYDEFAAPFWLQVKECGYRVFSQYWRTPSYIYSKLTLTVVSAIFIGFTFFRSSTSQQGIQNQILAIFMLMTIFGNYVWQILPNFLQHRNLFEARERPAKIYSWQAFMLVNIIVELFWCTIIAVLMFFAWYYPIGMYQNAIATGDVVARGGLMFLFVWSFMLFMTTFAFFIVAGFEGADEAGSIGSLLFSLSLTFCGVLATPSSLPGFWIFMYRISPLTYLISGMVSTAVGNSDVVCSSTELLSIPPPSGMSCEQYLGPFIHASGAHLQNNSATSDCLLCPVSRTDTVLAQFGIFFTDRWRNFGLMFVYIIFNVIAALGIYWLSRVPHHKNKKSTKDSGKDEPAASTGGKKRKISLRRAKEPTFEMFDGSLAPGQARPSSPSNSFASSTLASSRQDSQASLIPSQPNSAAPISAAPAPPAPTPVIRRVDRSLPMTPVAETPSADAPEEVVQLPPPPPKPIQAKSKHPPMPTSRYSTMVKDSRKPSRERESSATRRSEYTSVYSTTHPGPRDTADYFPPMPTAEDYGSLSRNYSVDAPSSFSGPPPSTGMAPSSITTPGPSTQGDNTPALSRSATQRSNMHYSPSQAVSRNGSIAQVREAGGLEIPPVPTGVHEMPASRTPHAELPTSQRDSLAPPSPRRRSNRNSASSLGSEVAYSGSRLSWNGSSDKRRSWGRENGDKRKSWGRTLLPIMDFGDEFEFSTASPQQQSGDGRVVDASRRGATKPMFRL